MRGTMGLTSNCGDRGQAQRLWRDPHYLLQSRMVAFGYVPRGARRHIFSMMKANGREQERLAPYFEIRRGSGGRACHQCQGISGAPGVKLGDACARESQKRWSPALCKPAETHFAAAACRRHRTMEGHWAGLANTHG